jgi:hypothetical protein
MRGLRCLVLECSFQLSKIFLFCFSGGVSDVDEDNWRRGEEKERKTEQKKQDGGEDAKQHATCLLL